MSDDGERISIPLIRTPSGIPGLDVILRGGFFQGGVYMLLAAPGSGKTILGNQICFQHVASAGRALYVTLLTESHARLLASLSTLSFFDAGLVGTRLSYVTAYQALEKDKLRGLLASLRQLVRDHKATLLVIDGFVTAGSMAETDVETKKFIHELQVFAELVGCTTLLLTGATQAADEYALRTMVDGLIELRQEPVGMAQVRTIEVKKFRGSGILMGRHMLEITDAGVSIYPRTESYRGRSVERPGSGQDVKRAPCGVAIVDAMLGGGFRPGSINMLLGSPGSGKTLLGLSFLAAGAGDGERGLYFGFFETPAELRRKGDAIGLELSRHLHDGLIELVRESPVEALADALVERIVKRIHESGVRRVVIDGIAGLIHSLAHPERARTFLGALCDELRSFGVATLLTDETRGLGELDTRDPSLAALLDGVVILRHVEVGRKTRKQISVTRTRDGACDPTLHEFSITERGFVAAELVSDAGLHGPTEPTDEHSPSHVGDVPSRRR